MEENRKDLLVAVPAALLFIVLGVSMLYGGWYIYDDIAELRSHGTKTEGRILRYKRIERNRVDESMVVPVVEFTTDDGETVVVEGKVDDVSILQNICHSGERVEIIYDPKDPRHAVINTFAELWFGPLLLWSVGLGFIIAPPFTIWKHFRSSS